MAAERLPPRARIISTMKKLSVLLGLVAVALIASGCESAFPPPAVTDQALEIRDLYNLVFAVAAFVFVLVQGLIIWSVIRYRRKPGDSTLPVQTHGNLILEIVWTVIPLIVVVALFFASARVLNIVDDRQPENVGVKIEVVGYQWQWKFAYPAEKIEIFGAATAYPEMVVPINERIEITLVGQDVNHGFYIPQFLFQRDMVPGKTNYFEFTPNKLGTFTGQCSAFCGLLHHQMGFTVRVVTREEYDAWIEATRPKEEPAATGPMTGVVKEWGITLSAAKHVAGSIEFNLTNEGTMPHEFLVVRSDKTAKQLLDEVRAETNRLDEATLDVIDEQAEWEPNTPGMVTVTLEPGNYVVLCNIAGHYAQGMYADLVVVAQP
jgi:cytochrome c oxidase subunit 2